MARGDQSALQKIKKLDEQRISILASAKEEALAKVMEAIAELNELGFDYTLTESRKTGRKSARPRGTMSEAPCPICDFMTSPPHDGRRHRSQGNKKKRFTVAELRELGLEKVE